MSLSARRRCVSLPPKAVPKCFLYLCAAIGLVFSLAGSILLYSQVLRGRKQTEAEILSVEVESYQEHDEGQTFTAYRARYQVRYQAEGRLFQLPLRGNLVSHSADEAKLKVRTNTVGARRTIYYLPERPENFVLDPLERRAGLSLLFLSIGLTIVAASLLLWYQARPLDW
jgi:hypothetical protein